MIETAVYKNRIYPQLIDATLRQIFPDPYLFENILEHDAKEKFESKLPLFRWFWREGHLSLYLICRHRLNIGKFFYEMIQRWLLPGKRLDVSSFFSCDFKINPLGMQLYTLAEMSIRVDSEIEWEHAEHNLRIIDAEIRLGMVSVYHASRLLEMHLLSSQDKMGALQEKISKLIQRNPDEIDYDIFGELQHFIVMSKDEFKMAREPHHLSRIITLFYLFRKWILQDLEKKPVKRQIRLKIGSVQLNLPWGLKKVLGVCVGLNFLIKNELFEERHLLRALQNRLSGIKAVPDSFFVNEGIEDGVHTLYLEIEKESGSNFTAHEIQTLQRFLPEDLKGGVEVPHRSLFMPRNEEEIIRHIVTLSGQLKFVKDKPQFILIFDEEKEGDLYFTVILVRILHADALPIHDFFSKEPSFLAYIPERVKRVGMLRKRYPKEATVFRVKLSSQPFLRDDYSVDLFHARAAVVQELQRVLGDLRDYTGGMIAQQVEVLKALQRLIGEPERLEGRLLEKFFHSIHPIEARSIVAPKTLHRLFLLWKELLEDPLKKSAQSAQGSELLVMGRQGEVAELDPAQFREMQLVSVRPEHEEKFLGYIFFAQSKEERDQFLGLTYSLKLTV